MTVNCYGVSCLGWGLVHPHANCDMVGYIPSFIDNSSDVPLIEQINAEYISGWHKSDQPWKRDLKSNTMWACDEDQPFRMIARYHHKPTGEYLEFYESSFTAVVKPDGTFEVARLD